MCVVAIGAVSNELDCDSGAGAVIISGEVVCNGCWFTQLAGWIVCEMVPPSAFLRGLVSFIPTGLPLCINVFRLISKRR